jgi:hypothetical protein
LLEFRTVSHAVRQRQERFVASSYASIARLSIMVTTSAAKTHIDAPLR